MAIHVISGTLHTYPHSPCLDSPRICSWLLLPRLPVQHRGKPAFRCSKPISRDFYIDLWKKAEGRERNASELHGIAENAGEGMDRDAMRQKNHEFQKLLEVPVEERNRVQRLQIIDRAAAAIAAARALINEMPSTPNGLHDDKVQASNPQGRGITGIREESRQDGNSFLSSSLSLGQGPPGPELWAWSPTPNVNRIIPDANNLKASIIIPTYPNSGNLLVEKERSRHFLPLNFESAICETQNPSMPPFLSLLEEKKIGQTSSNLEHFLPSDEQRINICSSHAVETTEALHMGGVEALSGLNPDGSRWWRETYTENRPEGVICNWTLTRGVNGDESVEWEEKFWEAADQFDYKELGSEKSGRDAAGSVWREYWKESMWKDHKSGLTHIEKTADKWGKSTDKEWQEQWWEHYDASGKTEKGAHKWCCIDPKESLEAGHAHVWHERWGEKYDGHGGSMNFTDKWAERCEGDGWTKWGDKWDHNFDQNGHGIRQGETWWEGKHGERWYRTWGEHHNGSGWVHKYGKSSSSEHWDTYVQEETRYERYPHCGFDLCFKNSWQLREVGKLAVA